MEVNVTRLDNIKLIYSSIYWVIVHRLIERVWPVKLPSSPVAALESALVLPDG
jgi:hypothetical protein